MSNITEYQNLVEFLKQTLEFYAKGENWSPEHNYSVCVEVQKSLIDLDSGTQAKFALEKIKEFDKNQTDSMEDYIKNIEETLEGNDNVDDLYKTLNELKRIANENK